MRVSYGALSFELPIPLTDRSTIQLVREVDDKALHAGQYPLSLTVHRDAVGSAPHPLAYLQSKLTHLRPHLARYQQAFCERTEVGGHAAARAQFSFVAELELVQLVLVWFLGDQLVAANVTTTAQGVDEGWSLLNEVAPSLRID